MITIKNPCPVCGSDAVCSGSISSSWLLPNKTGLSLSIDIIDTMFVSDCKLLCSLACYDEYNSARDEAVAAYDSIMEKYNA